MFEDVSFRGRSFMTCPLQEDVIWIENWDMRFM